MALCACSVIVAALQSRALDPRTGYAMFHRPPHIHTTDDALSTAVACVAAMQGRNGGADPG